MAVTDPTDALKQQSAGAVPPPAKSPTADLMTAAANAPAPARVPVPGSVPTYGQAVLGGPSPVIDLGLPKLSDGGLQSNYVGSGPTDPDVNGRNAAPAAAPAPATAGTSTMAGFTADAQSHLQSLYPKGTFEGAAPAVPAAPAPAAPAAQAQAPSPLSTLAPRAPSAGTQELINAQNNARTPVADAYAGPAAAPMPAAGAPGKAAPNDLQNLQSQLANIQKLNAQTPVGGLVIGDDPHADSGKGKMTAADMASQLKSIGQPRMREALASLFRQQLSGESAQNTAQISQMGHLAGIGMQLPVTMRGQDLNAETAAAGHQIQARGQDLNAATAAAGQQVQARGQDLSAETSRYGVDTNAQTQANAQANQLGIAKLNNEAAGERTQAQIAGQKAVADQAYGRTKETAMPGIFYGVGKDGKPILYDERKKMLGMAKP